MKVRIALLDKYMTFLIRLGRGFVGDESTQEPIEWQTYPCLGLGEPEPHDNTRIRVCAYGS